QYLPSSVERRLGQSGDKASLPLPLPAVPTAPVALAPKTGNAPTAAVSYVPSAPAVPQLPAAPPGPTSAVANGKPPVAPAGTALAAGQMPLGVQSVIAASNGLDLPIRYIPVAI